VLWFQDFVPSILSVYKLNQCRQLYSSLLYCLVLDKNNLAAMCLYSPVSTFKATPSIFKIAPSLISYDFKKYTKDKNTVVIVLRFFILRNIFFFCNSIQ